MLLPLGLQEKGTLAINLASLLASKRMGCLAQAPGYSKIVTRPMAFSIMWERFRKGEYMTWEELQADLNQMYRNAMTYNRPETVFHKQVPMLLQDGPCQRLLMRTSWLPPTLSPLQAAMQSLLALR